MIRKNNYTLLPDIVKKILQNPKYFLIGLISVSCLVVLSYFDCFFYAGGTWNIVTWSFNYSYGFISRGFLGTLLDTFSAIFGSEISIITWRIFNFVTTLIFIGIIILFFYLSIQKMEKQCNKSTVILLKITALVFILSWGISTYINIFGSPDIYLIILTLVACLILISDTNILIQSITALGIPVICLLIHPGYIFLYFNIILVLLLYKAFIPKQSEINKYYLSLLVLTFLMSSILFIYLQFYSHVSTEITSAYVLERAEMLTDYSVDRSIPLYIQEQLFGESGLTDPLFGIKTYGISLLISIIVYLLFILLAAKFWTAVITNSKMIRDKVIYLLISLGILTTIPMFIMQVDFGRWCYAIVFYEIIVIFCLAVMGDKSVLYALHSLVSFFKEKPVIFVLLIALSLILGTFLQCEINVLPLHLQDLGRLIFFWYF